nr:outer membrane beta-barrel protein [uncultured Carboxylicivirga sp.]
MKRIFITFLLVIESIIAFAQPNNGFRGGINWTYHSNKTFNDTKYYTELGWQFGYAWNIKTYKNLSIRTELMIDKNVVGERWPKYEGIPNGDSDYESGEFIGYGQKSDIDMYYINLPVGINYLFKKRYFITAGYRLSYQVHNNYYSGTYGPKWMHSCYMGGGVHFRYFDVDIRYVIQCNDEVVSTYWTPNEDGTFEDRSQYAGKNNTLQISLTVPLKWRD